jgi:hypothetical protein
MIVKPVLAWSDLPRLFVLLCVLFFVVFGFRFGM